MEAEASTAKLNEIAIENFRKYLRIPSVQPDVNYDDCVKFIKELAADIGLEFKVYEIVKNKPIVVLALKGSNPELSSILLNSHMDVVPVFPEYWSHKPFDAEIDANGNIYARGSQDMKCVGIGYVEAIRRLKLKNIKMKRNVYISFCPDEEIGGVDGMQKFVRSQEFKNLNVGIMLDEGYSSPGEPILIFNRERSIWQIEFTCYGSEGHGSILLENTAGEKMRKLLDRLMDFRESQSKKLKTNPQLTLGDVTTVNLTMIKGGIEANVVPPSLSVTFDFRISADLDVDNLENQLKNWISESGGGIEMRWIRKSEKVPQTKLDDTNHFWVAIKNELMKMKWEYKVETFPGGTDGRYCRQIGIPVIGISPINNTPILLHAHNEYLNKDIFLKGIGFYENVIPAMANVK